MRGTESSAPSSDRVSIAVSPSTFIEWDSRNWSGALDFWTKHSRQDLSKARALELGSRNGGLSLWLALQGARVVCSDIVQPEAHVVERHRAHGVGDLVEYRAIDTTHIPYTEQFDVVVFKSVLGAVGRVGGLEAQAHAIAQMHKALKKGGELLFAENLTASAFHRFLRRRFVRWGNTWRYVSIPEMEAFLAGFSRVEYCTLGVIGAFGRGERQRSLLGRLDSALLNRFVPEHWRYLIAGIATK